MMMMNSPKRYFIFTNFYNNIVCTNHGKWERRQEATLEKDTVNKNKRYIQKMKNKSMLIICVQYVNAQSSVRIKLNIDSYGFDSV